MKKNVKFGFLMAACAFSLVCAGVGASTVTLTASATSNETDTMYCDGASIRVADDNNNGIRFRVAMNKTDYEALNGAITGMLYIPTDLLGAEELTKDFRLAGEDGELNTADDITPNNDETTKVWRTYVNNDGTKDEAKVQSCVYTYDIPEESYNREITWRAYYINDVGEYVYSQTSSSRSVASVALAAENEGDNRGASFIKNYDVTFNYGYKENGGWKTETQSVRYGSTISPSVEREGFTFDGWDGYDFSNAVTGKEEASAKWTLNSNLFLDTTNIETVESYPADIWSRLENGSAVAATHGYEHKVIADETLNKNVLSISTKSTWKGTKQHASMEFYPFTVPAGAKLYIKASVDTSTKASGADLYVNGKYKDTFKIDGAYQYGAYKTFTITFEEAATLSSIAFRPYVDTAAYTFNIATLDIITDLTDIDFDETLGYGEFFSGSTYTRGFADDADYGTLLTATTAKPTNKLVVTYNNLVLPAGTTITVHLKWTHTDTATGGAVQTFINDTKTTAWLNKPDQWWDYSTTLSEETTLKKFAFNLNLDFAITIYLDYITITLPKTVS